MIVVGVDGSDTSLPGGGLRLRYGPAAARPARRRVRAAGAGGGRGARGAGAETTDEIAGDLVRQVREASEQVRRGFGFRWGFHTFRGDPYNGMVKAADDLTADAVVVGASEQAGHRFVGSVAVRLVKAGRRPVTVVPWTPPRRKVCGRTVSEGAQKAEEDLVEGLGPFPARVVSRPLDGGGAAVVYAADETLGRRGQIGGFE